MARLGRPQADYYQVQLYWCGRCKKIEEHKLVQKTSNKTGAWTYNCRGCEWPNQIRATINADDLGIALGPRQKAENAKWGMRELREKENA